MFSCWSLVKFNQVIQNIQRTMDFEGKNLSAFYLLSLAKLKYFEKERLERLKPNTRTVSNGVQIGRLKCLTRFPMLSGSRNFLLPLAEDARVDRYAFSILCVLWGYFRFPLLTIDSSGS